MIRFMVEIWQSPDEPVAYTAIATALHIEDAEVTAVAQTPGDAAKMAVDELIGKQLG